MVDFNKVKEGAMLPTVAAIGFLILSTAGAFAIGFAKGSQASAVMDILFLQLCALIT